MGTYIALLRFEPRDSEPLKAAPELLEAYLTSHEGGGLEPRSAFLTLGAHDALVVFEAANDAAVARLTSLDIGSRPEIRSSVLRGFSRDQYREFFLSETVDEAR